MAISLVQKTAAATNITTGQAKAFNSDTVAGNLLIATLGGSGVTSAVSATDTQGNTWILGELQVNNPGFQISSSMVLYALNTKGGPNNVTFSWSGGTTLSAGLLEYSGTNTFDQAAGSNRNSTTLFISVTLPQTNELMVGIISTGGAGQTWTPLTNCTIQISNINICQTVDSIPATSGSNVWGVSGMSSAQNSGAVLTFLPTPSTFSILGNAGVAGANVAYSGTASGNVTADGSGNYTISGLLNGPYTITPSLAGYTFSPTSQNETVSGGNITGVNFTTTQVLVYSVPDCRISYCGLVPTTNLYPNGSVNVNGTLTYTVETSNNPAIPPVDSRKAGAPVASGTYPQNSRTPGTFGPGE